MASALGLAEAVRFQEQVGRERIASRGRALVARLRAALSRVPGMDVLTPGAPGTFASMLTFRTTRVPYDRLFSRLLAEHQIRCRPVTEAKLNALRVSLHHFNTLAECDKLIDATEKMVRGA